MPLNVALDGPHVQTDEMRWLAYIALGVILTTLSIYIAYEVAIFSGSGSLDFQPTSQFTD